jgi:hypothetical protein
MTDARTAVEAAAQRLKTARHGVADMTSDPNRYMSGFMNAVTFARMVTFALQNMKNDVPGWAEWYASRQAAMANDPSMKFFVDLRNAIEKTAKGHMAMSTYIASFSSKDTGRPPPGATSFVVGSAAHGGANGWIVPAEDGSEELFVVNFPEDKIKTTMHFLEAPELMQGKDPVALIKEHLDKLEALIGEARAEFVK